MGLDSRLLIKQVEARPPLWNRDDRDYCHQKIVSKLWAEIAHIHGVHESRVKSKWKALRDTFRQELKKNPHQSPWSFYLDMQFIKGQLKSAPSARGKPGFEEEPDEVTFVKPEPEEPEDSAGYYQEDYTTTPATQSEEPDGDEPRCSSMDVEEDGTLNDDDDYHFLMSLLPEMRKLEPRQKLLLRIKIMQLFYQEVYQQQS